MPRMPENITLDTGVSEPPMSAGETEMLLFALDRSRATFAWKCGGLDAEALRRPFPPSTMTLGGLLKHLALVEDEYTTRDLTGESMGVYWPVEARDPEWVWRSAAQDSPEELYGRWRDAVDRSRAAWTRALAEGGPDQRSLFTWRDGRSPNLRRLLVDLHDEYARHTGHADLFREAIDGLVGEDPPQPGA
jgi:uncharacterized damage-inducible protein DinB